MESSGPRKPYPSDVSDEVWAFVTPYLTLMRADAPRRTHDVRGVSHALRWVVRTGAQSALRVSAVGSGLPVNAALDHGRRVRRDGPQLALAAGLRRPQFLDSSTTYSSPGSGYRAGYDGSKRKQGSNVNAAVDTLGELPALHVIRANASGPAQVGVLTQAVQGTTDDDLEMAFVDQGHTGQPAADAAAEQRVEIVVVKLEEVKRDFVVLTRRWVIERHFVWASRLQRQDRDLERLPIVVASLHFLAFSCLLVLPLVALAAQSPLQPLAIAHYRFSSVLYSPIS